MAILIPSKNIYNIDFNPVIDNQIDKVELMGNNAVADLQYDTTIFNNRYENGFNETLDYVMESGAFNMQQNEVACSFRVGSYEIANTNKFSYDILIPYKKDNGIITRIYNGVTEIGENKISYSIIGEKEIGTVKIPYSASLLVSGKPAYGALVVVSSIQKKVETDDGEIINNLFAVPDNNFVTIEKTKEKYVLNDILNERNSHLPINRGDLINDNVGTVKVNKIKKGNDEYYQLNIQNVLSSLTWVTTPTEKSVTLTAYYNSESGELNCSFEKYIAQEIEFNINGDIHKIELNAAIEKIGDGNKVYSFDGNELIQTTNTPTLEKWYQKIIDNWKDGKQTATITCPIADFYDENGNKVIDTSVSGKMMFDIGDIVIPYTYTNQGDKPIAYNKDVTPKQFKVVGTKISKKQGVSQELTLQEV